MVVGITVHHVFRHPIEFVARTHFTKYPTEKEKFVVGVTTLENSWNPASGIQYKRRVAICQNVIPSALRKLYVMNVERIELEEQAWLDTRRRHLRLTSRNLTWMQYADMREESVFSPHQNNPQWTVLTQKGSIEVKGLGILGSVIEMFAQQFLSQGVKRAMKIMDELLEERSHKSCKDDHNVRSSVDHNLNTA